jgi:hypothetical protein
MNIGARAEFSTNIENYVGEVNRSDILLNAGVEGTYYFGQPSAEDANRRDPWAAVTIGAKWIERASEQSALSYDDFTILVSSTFTY